MIAELNAGNTDTPNTIPHLLLTNSFIVYIPKCVVIGYNQSQSISINISETKVRMNTNSFPGKLTIFLLTQVFNIHFNIPYY